jgi:hypothetical protein
MEDKTMAAILTRTPVDHLRDLDGNGHMVCWVRHAPKLKGKGAELRREADCECGIKRRHVHCSRCGKLVSCEDWDDKAIATFYLGG